MAYKNYLSVMIKIYRHKDYIDVILRDNKKQKWTYNYCVNYSFFNNFDFNNVEDYFNSKVDYLEFKYKDKLVKLYGIREGNGNIGDVFVNNDYWFLTPENEIVIDIGASIGDSSIYFGLNNAKKIIALEPYPYTYNFSIKNIEINNLSDKIMILNAGYGPDSEIKVDENKVTNAGSDLTKSQKGKIIQLFSLKTLMDNYGLKDNLLLKMDCEGCEYNILEEEIEVLKKFKRIQIEYHYGYVKLVSKLKECGFNVKYTKPRKLYNTDSSNPNMYLGYIYAKKD